MFELDRVARHRAHPAHHLLQSGDGCGRETVDEFLVAGEVGTDPCHRVVHLLGVDSSAHRASSTGIVRNLAAWAPAASDMNPASVPAADEAQAELDELGQKFEVADARDPEDGVVGPARLRHRSHGVEEGVVAELAEDAHLGGEVVRTDHHNVEPGDGCDLIRTGHGLGRLEHDGHDRVLVVEVEQLALRHGLITVRRAGTGHRPMAARREPTGRDDRLALLPGLDVRDDHPHRADVERTGQEVVVVRRDSDERCDPRARSRTRRARSWSRTRSWCAPGRRRRHRSPRLRPSSGRHRSAAWVKAMQTISCPASRRSRIEGTPCIMLVHRTSVTPRGRRHLDPAERRT